jgi:DNA-binding LacI/PurR family transcriptional regulator
MSTRGYKPSMAITIRDLANACGCDSSTVSRALRDDPRIAAETRQLVQAAAQRLGYRVNLAARALITGKTRTIWLLADNQSSPVNHHPTETAAARLRAQGYDLLIAVHHGDATAHARLLDRLLQGVCDGVLILGDRLDLGNPSLKSLQKSGFPIVFIDRHDPGLAVPAVSSANAAAAAALVATCATVGAAVVVDTFCDENTVAAARSAGLRLAAGRLGLTVLSPAAAASDPRRQIVIGSNQGVTALHGPALVALGVFDAWIGAPPPGVSVWVQPQDFTAIAEVAVDLLLAQLAGKAVTPGVRQVACPLQVRVG